MFSAIICVYQISSNCWIDYVTSTVKNCLTFCIPASSFCRYWTLCSACYKKKQMCTGREILFMYSFSGNCAASFPIFTFMCLWAIYIVPGLVHIFPLQQKRQTDCRNKYIFHRHMNVEIGTEAPIFLFWEYLFRICCILSLQCGPSVKFSSSCFLTSPEPIWEGDIRTMDPKKYLW